MEARPTVGLGLIARDEETTLPRLLASCAAAFDEVVLIDTGSVDGTVERFNEWAATQPGVRCHVGHFEWIDDFAAARQAAFEALTSDWWAWADCDDVIEGAAALRSLAAGADSSVVGFTARYDYAPTEFARHVRLARAGTVRWRGPIHETLELLHRRGELHNVDARKLRWIHHPAPSEAAKPRMQRDLQILERQVRADPDDSRAVFYLAQTCRDLGLTERAVELYLKRAEMEGWDEERFFAQFQAGSLLSETDWPQAAELLMRAWEMRPTRIEPVQRLSAGLRVRGLYQSAHRFATAGLEAPLPDDQLFVASWVYGWGMLFEYSITGYWVGQFGAALAACDRLLARDDLPDLHREQTRANRKLCAEAVARDAAATHYRIETERVSTTMRHDRVR